MGQNSITLDIHVLSFNMQEKYKIGTFKVYLRYTFMNRQGIPEVQNMYMLGTPTVSKGVY